MRSTQSVLKKVDAIAVDCYKLRLTTSASLQYDCSVIEIFSNSPAIAMLDIGLAAKR